MSLTFNFEINALSRMKTTFIVGNLFIQKMFSILFLQYFLSLWSKVNIDLTPLTIKKTKIF